MPQQRPLPGTFRSSPGLTEMFPARLQPQGIRGSWSGTWMCLFSPHTRQWVKLPLVVLTSHLRTPARVLAAHTLLPTTLWAGAQPSLSCTQPQLCPHYPLSELAPGPPAQAPAAAHSPSSSISLRRSGSTTSLSLSHFKSVMNLEGKMRDRKPHWLFHSPHGYNSQDWAQAEAGSQELH